MPFDFQTPIDRRGTHTLKWDNVHRSEGQPDVVPLWVADMDFAVPPAVHKALTERVAHPIYGYTNLPAAYFEAVAAWHSQRYGRTIDTSEFLLTPSVLHAMSLAVRTFTAPGDSILNLPPVYYPFFKLVYLHDRIQVDVPLARRGTRWEMDFAAIEAALAEAETRGKPVKALLFSSPHNPTSRVWSREELERLTALAEAWDFVILSDEIHADLISPGFKHVSFADIPAASARSLVFSGPNKTFNIAGLHISHVIVRDPELKSRLKRAIEGDFYDQPNVLSMTAALAAYREGGPWLDELLVVLQQNWGVLKTYLTRWNKTWSISPALESVPLEATYLAWVDFSPLIERWGFQDDRDLAQFLEETGRVKMTAGSIFRSGGSRHLRFNLATHPSTLIEGLNRVEKALETLSAQRKNG